MSEKSTTLTVVIAGAVVVVSVAAIALYLLTKGDPVGIPPKFSCSGEGDCPVTTECTACWGCHRWLGTCVYHLKASEFCRCIPGERKNCEAEGKPGAQTCGVVGKDNTDWGKCESL